MDLFTCHRLSVGYQKQAVLCDLSFSVPAGAYVCIVGENGAGKSTFLKTMLGLLPTVSGELVFGNGVEKTSIGYLPQQTPQQKEFPATVQEIVRSGCQGRCKVRPFYSKKDKAKAKEAMARLGLSGLEKRSFRALSGGQQQRVLLARALCAANGLLVLDEPVAGLDPNATEGMYQLILDLNRRDGCSILMISHDVKKVLQDATHVLHLGPKVFFGTVEAYCNSDIGASFLQRAGEEAHHG